MANSPLAELAEGSDLMSQVLGGTLPGLWPTPAEKVDGSKLDPEKPGARDWKVRYARFRIEDETGDKILEEIMTKIVKGDFIFGSEVSSFDKFGNAYILIKWYEPVPKKVEKKPGAKKDS
jgi:hypothetical protein